LIEEAAGITKFKVRKRESQRKLEATDQNLVRLQDIIGEQKRQIDSLERQAQRAERYRRLKTELQEKDLWLASHQYLQMRDESTSAERIFTEARDSDAGAQAQVAELDAKLATLRLELTEKEAAVQISQNDHRQKLSQTQETEFRIRELNMAIDQARRSNEMTGSMLSQYQLRQENLETEKADLTEKLTDSREESVRLESDLTAKDQVYQEIVARIQKADQELTDARREMLGLQTSLSHLETREGVLTNRHADESKRFEASQALTAELHAKKGEFEERRNRLFKDLEVERQMQLDLTRDVDLIQQNLQGVKRQVTDRRLEADDLKDALNKVASRLYGLENLQSNFEGFEEGVKNVMMWQRSRPVVEGEATEGFRPLAEVVEVPAKYELAMEASLGTRLQLLLSGSHDQSLGAVDYLKTQKRGRSSFLSGGGAGVEMVTESVSAVDYQALKSEEGVQALLGEVVSIPEVYKPQVATFFSDVVVVDSIRTALRLRSTYPTRTFVTLEGDTLTADGVLTGGASESADSGVLKRRREIKELSLEREELAGKVQLAQLSLKKLEEQEIGLGESLEAAKKTAVEKEILLAGLKKDLERAENEFGNAQTAWERESREAAKIENEINSLKNTLSEVTRQAIEMREKKTGLEAQVQSLTDELTASRSGVDEKGREVTDLKVRAASRRQEVESFERELNRLETTLNELSQNLAQMSEETARNTSTLNVSQIEVESLQTELQRLIHQTHEAELTASRTRDEFETAAGVVRSIEESLSKANHDLNALRARMNEAQLKLEQTRMKEGYLVEQMHERYQLNLADVATSYIQSHTRLDAPEETVSQYTREVEELRDKIKRIGEVNLSAIQEYDDVKQRYEFLSQQHTDLLEAKENLRKVIDRINRICSRRFKDTFEQVNERFKKVFPVLFGGGEAHLILLENAETDDPGIDIVARPPGKKMQNVTLLSGGEKALTAVSLIFSIFLVKPSPFCLLDEVDAPLDDANVYRFNDLVKEMAKRSQIIVVTHNKHTMRVNNKLYGVTMQEKGVSKMVSVSLADAERLAQS